MTEHAAPLHTLDSLVLQRGNHTTREEGVCLLEAVAWWAGESHSDHPAGVSPVLAAFGREWNDGMRSDAERVQLVQYILLLAGTAGDPDADARRAWMAADWLIRTHLPAWLRLAGLRDHAAPLAALPVVGPETAEAAYPMIHAARAAASDAVGDAAEDAVADAAWDAAGDAARDAAGAAARAAAEEALEPTVQGLQASAHDLYQRMIRA